ncbi:MAG: hypothetical protein V3V10_08955 [Planctomycetota bacterium]
MNIKKLIQLAGRTYFERGKAYYKDGAANLTQHTDTSYGALVRGTEAYVVDASWADDTEYSYSCTCPVETREEFCKHLVAAGLAYLNRGQKPSPYETIRAWLFKQDRDWLAKQMADLVATDPKMFTRYELMASMDEEFAVETMERIIDQVTETDGWVGYEESKEFAANILSTIAVVEQAVENHPSEVKDLCTFFITAINGAKNYVEDAIELHYPVERLEQLHVWACELARTDPVELAQELFEYETGDGLSMTDCLDKYSKALGTRGRAEFERLVESTWAAVPPRVEHGKHVGKWFGHGQRRDLERLMLYLAQRRADPDLMISVLSKDLSKPRAYEYLVETCRKYERFGQALDWAKQGVDKDGIGDELGLIYAEELKRAGKVEVAVEVVWQRYIKLPCISRYNELKEYGEDWNYWRDKAVGHIRKTMAYDDKSDHESLRSMLVDIFIAESNIVMALAEVASGRCCCESRIRLAEVCDPKNSIILYRQLITEMIDSTTNAAKTSRSYRQSVELMQKMHARYVGLGRESDFLKWLDKIKTEYSRKRNLISLIRKHWP